MPSIIEDAPNTDFVCKPSQYSLLRRANLNGFAALPDEIFLEILSHYPPVPVELSGISRKKVIRRATLKSLSEVCQNLRRVFRAYLWQHVEVYKGIRVGPGRQKLDYDQYWDFPKRTTHYAKELLRQLHVVTIQDPSLARHVRVVDIEVNDYSFRSVFIELGRCFSLFPNLHTVKIATHFFKSKTDEKAWEDVKRGFKRSVLYPQIRSVFLSPSVHPLLVVCPNLESLTTSNESPILLTSIKRLRLQKLTVPLSLRSATAIAEGPSRSSLQEITLFLASSRIPQKRNQLIELIRSLPNLRILTFQYFPQARTHLPSMLLAIVRRFFLGLSPRDRQNLKKVIFQQDGHEEKTLVLA